MVPLGARIKVAAMTNGDMVIYTINRKTRHCEVLETKPVPGGLREIDTGVSHDATRYKLRDVETKEEFWSTLLRDD